MKNYLRLVRWPNLLLLMLTQVSAWLCLPIAKIGAIAGVYHAGGGDFLLLCFATVLITAAGYVINDIADIEIDKINKPDKQWVGQQISVRQAGNFYLCLNLIALLMGCFLTSIEFLPIFIFSILLLWLYSYYLKKMPLIGNIVVALLTALSIAELLLLEYYWYEYTDNDFFASPQVLIYLFYISFAFLTTLIREIVKDLEDMEGDKQQGAKTLPIVIGIKATKIVLCGLILVLLAALYSLLAYLLDPETILLIAYICILLILPISAFIWFLYQSNIKHQFSTLSFFLKGYMLAGLGLLWLLGYII